MADVRRSRPQKKVVAYAGVAPGTRKSASKRKDLGITHAGSRIPRWSLCQAAWQLVRRDNQVTRDMIFGGAFGSRRRLFPY